MWNRAEGWCWWRCGSSQRIPCDSDMPSSPAVPSPYENHWCFGFKMPWTNSGSATQEPLWPSVYHFIGADALFVKSVQCLSAVTVHQDSLWSFYNTPGPGPHPRRVWPVSWRGALAWGISSTPGDAATWAQLWRCVTEVLTSYLEPSTNG